MLACACSCLFVIITINLRLVLLACGLCSLLEFACVYLCLSIIARACLLLVVCLLLFGCDCLCCSVLFALVCV